MKRRYEGLDTGEFISALEIKKTSKILKYFEKNAFYLLEDWEDISKDTLLYLLENEEFLKYGDQLYPILFKNFSKTLSSMATSTENIFKTRWTIAERGLRVGNLEVVYRYLQKEKYLYEAFKGFFDKQYQKTLEYIINNSQFTSIFAGKWYLIYVADALTNYNKCIFERRDIPKFQSFSIKEKLTIVRYLLKNLNFDPRIHRDDFLMDAVEKSNIELLRCLLSFKSIINTLEFDYSPLREAIRKSDPKVLKCFIECEALQASSIQFDVIFDCIRDFEKTECLFDFLTIPFYKNCFLSMGLNKILTYPQKIIELIAKEPSLYDTWLENKKNFQSAIQNGLISIVKNALTPDLPFNRYELLITACKSSNSEIVRALLDEDHPELNAILQCQTIEDQESIEELWIISATRGDQATIHLLTQHLKLEASRKLGHPVQLLQLLHPELLSSIKEYLFSRYGVYLPIQEQIYFAIQFSDKDTIRGLIQKANRVTASNFGLLLRKGYINLAKDILSQNRLLSYQLEDRIAIFGDSLNSVEALTLVRNDRSVFLSPEEISRFLNYYLPGLIHQDHTIIQNFLTEIVLNTFKEGVNSVYFESVLTSVLEHSEEYFDLICMVNHMELTEYIVNSSEIIYFSKRHGSYWIANFLDKAAEMSSLEIILKIINSLFTFNYDQYLSVVIYLLQYAFSEHVFEILDVVLKKHNVLEDSSKLLTLCIESQTESVEKFIILMDRFSLLNTKPDGVEVLQHAMRCSNQEVKNLVMLNKNKFDWRSFFIFIQNSCADGNLRLDITLDRYLLSHDFEIKKYYLECLTDPKVILQLQEYPELKDYKETIIKALQEGIYMLIENSLLKYSCEEGYKDNRFYYFRNMIFNLGQIKYLTQGMLLKKYHIFKLLDFFPADYHWQDNSSKCFVLFFELYLHSYTYRPIASLQEFFKKAGFYYLLDEDIKNITFPMEEAPSRILFELLWQDTDFQNLIDKSKLIAWINKAFKEENAKDLLEIINCELPQTAMLQ